jgi:putative membrane protein
MDARIRDDLANERTFLAYLRTSLAFIAFGFVIARFSLFAREISVVAHITIPSTHLSTAFGTSMACAGVALGLYGSGRYVAMRSAIVQSQPRPMPAWAAITGGVIVAATGIVVAAALFSVR